MSSWEWVKCPTPDGMVSSARFGRPTTGDFSGHRSCGIFRRWSRRFPLCFVEFCQIVGVLYFRYHHPELLWRISGELRHSANIQLPGGVHL